MPVFSSDCWVPWSETVDGNIHATNVALCFDSAETEEQEYKFYKISKTFKKIPKGNQYMR